MITLVSTAKPMVSTRPAIPGAVNVAPRALKMPIVNNRFKIRAIFATQPAVLKYTSIKANMIKKATRKAMEPPLIASCPSVGPTTCSCTILAGAGSLPLFKISDKSCASCKE